MSYQAQVMIAVALVAAPFVITIAGAFAVAFWKERNGTL